MAERVNYELDLKSNKMNNVDVVGKIIYNKVGDAMLGLSFHDKLCLNTEYVDEPPANVNAPWSRFVVYLSSKGKRLEANIPWDDVKGIARLTQTFHTMDLQSESPGNTETDENQPCYKVILLSRAESLKGKTPAQVLKENPALEKDLLQQVDFLSQNLARYPKNQVQIDAIRQAIELCHAGRLKETVSLVKDLYVTEMKSLSSRKKGNKLFFYQIAIRYVMGQKAPIQLEITNLFAEPVINGTLKSPNFATAEDQFSASISIDFPRWEKQIDDLDRFVDNFVAEHQAANREKALDLAYSLRQMMS